MEERLEKFLANVRQHLDPPSKLREAADTAISHGCTFEQLSARMVWFYNHRFEWSPEHRPGAIYQGLMDCFRETKPHEAWPYKNAKRA